MNDCLGEKGLGQAAQLLQPAPIRVGHIASVPAVDFNDRPEFVTDAQVFPGSSGGRFSPAGKLLEGGLGALAGKEERAGERDLQRKIAELERALGRKTYELEIAAKAVWGWE
jgi:hypothetical protein